MSTLHSYAEAAIRRDLTRARALLATGSRLGTQRRRAVTDHLVWLTGLVQPGTAVISPAAAAVRDCAAEFGRDGLGPEREELNRAIDVFLRVTGGERDWTAPDVVRIAHGNLPWVLDAARGIGGRGLVLPPSGCPEQARWAASEYRRKRAMLWGAVALTPPRLLEQSARVG